MKAPPTILDVLNDPKVFGPYFKGPTWAAWRIFLAALFALPLTGDELPNFQKFTHRSAPSKMASHEAWLVCGRRAGKSFILAVIAIYLACFKDWKPYLAPGEFGTLMIVAADRRQARTIMRYCTGLLDAVPMLKRQIEGITKESITLKNNVVIEIHTASFRSTRGYTIISALLDEIGYWPTDEGSADFDVEVVNAIRPAMATIPEAMLLCASSPYGKKGVLWNNYKKHFAQNDDPVLVWQAATRDMNATVPQSFIDEHMADDPARAAAEYGAIFRADLEAFVSPEAVAACVDHGVHERAPQRGVIYRGFIDPSGGSADSFTAAISHYDLAQRTVIIDAMREVKPPFSPEEVCREFSTLFKSYGIRTIAGDRYAGTWPVEAFSKFGIVYEQSADPKSTLYLNLLPLINSGRIRLLHQQKSINQLLGLERRTARGGRDLIDHASNGHDDLANCIAGAAVVIDDKRTYYMAGLEVYQPGFVDLDRRTDVPNASPEQIAAREREEASNQRAVFQTMGYIRNLASSGFQFK